MVCCLREYVLEADHESLVAVRIGLLAAIGILMMTFYLLRHRPRLIMNRLRLAAGTETAELQQESAAAGRAFQELSPSRILGAVPPLDGVWGVLSLVEERRNRAGLWVRRVTAN